MHFFSDSGSWMVSVLMISFVSGLGTHGEPARQRRVTQRRSQVLNVVAHRIAIQYSVHQLQRSDELADAVLLFLAPGNAGVRYTRLVEGQIVRVKTSPSLAGPPWRTPTGLDPASRSAPLPVPLIHRP